MAAQRVALSLRRESSRALPASQVGWRKGACGRKVRSKKEEVSRDMTARRRRSASKPRDEKRRRAAE